jgi:hypothetical protein
MQTSRSKFDRALLPDGFSFYRARAGHWRSRDVHSTKAHRSDPFLFTGMALSIASTAAQRAAT